jgi:hypothetical protein
MKQPLANDPSPLRQRTALRLGKTLAVGFLALALDPRCQNHDSPAEERDGWA